MRKPLREIRICGDTAIIPLTKGYEAIIDAADAPLVAGRFWLVRVSGKSGYAQSADYSTGKCKTLLLHRVLLDAPDGFLVDHIDGDGLNNSRSNLRLCNRSQNAQNRGAPSHSSSGLKGVCWNAKDQRWRAHIQVNPALRLHLGSFLSKDAAAAAYAAAAIKYHGDFARAPSLVREEAA